MSENQFPPLTVETTVKISVISVNRGKFYTHLGVV